MDDAEAASANFLSLKNIPALISELAKIRKQRQTEFDAIADVFADPLELARLYVEPECQQENPANMPADDMQADHRTPAFATINRFLRKTHLDRDGRNHKIVLADAGMGKSSLLVMLWSFHRTKFWPSSISCELLKIGPDTLDHIRAMEAKSRTVLLLDALDEDPSSSDQQSAKNRLIELIDATLSFRKVIISCRTQFFVDEEDDPDFRLGHVRLGGYSCSVTYLSPFDDAQTNGFLEKRFPDSWHSFLTGPNQARLRALSISSKMGTLRIRPLLLAYIPLLLEKDEEGNSLAERTGELSEYEIYRYMITRWLDREAVKIRQHDSARAVTAAVLRTICWKIAMQLQLEGAKHMSDAMFSQMRSAFGAPQFLSGLLEGRTLLNKDSRGRFRFAHYSIQEFLFVEHCINVGPLFEYDEQPARFPITNVMRIFYGQHLVTRYRMCAQQISAVHPNRILLKLVLHPSCLVIAADAFLTGSTDWASVLQAHAREVRDTVSRLRTMTPQRERGAGGTVGDRARNAINDLIDKAEVADWDKFIAASIQPSPDDPEPAVPLISAQLIPVLFDLIKLVAVGLCDLKMEVKSLIETILAQSSWESYSGTGLRTMALPRHR